MKIVYFSDVLRHFYPSLIYLLGFLIMCYFDDTKDLDSMLDLIGIWFVICIPVFYILIQSLRNRESIHILNDEIYIKGKVIASEDIKRIELHDNSLFKGAPWVSFFVVNIRVNNQLFELYSLNSSMTADEWEDFAFTAKIDFSEEHHFLYV